MVANTAVERRPTFNPKMLRWARTHAGVSTAQAAKRVKVNEAWVEEWESEPPTKSPTVRQARELAKLYNRSFLEFFRASPPILPEPELIPDFRLFPRADDPSVIRELKDTQLWAEVQRLNALSLFAEIGEQPPSIPDDLFANTSMDYETVAANSRVAMGFPIQDQVERVGRGRDQIPIELRRKIEALGVLTLRRTDIGSFRVRGFCIAVFPLPIIVVGKETIPAQAFTLAHEFAHVLLKQSAISGPIPRTGGDESNRRVEKWCNLFASAFLMPRDVLERRFSRPVKPLAEISDHDLHRLALYFGVSDHAMLVRLVQLNYVKENYYWDVKKPQYDAQTPKDGGGPPQYYGTRYRNMQGDLYTGLVLEAWSMGRITGHHAAEYMGIKNIQHVYDIRDHYRGI